jgi:hypothetical protein
MPVSLGQAISGKYAQNYDSATPLLKGFQIGAQRRQNDEVAKARKEAAKQKQDENFLKQVSNSILVKGIDDLDKPAYQEAVGGIFAEAQKLAESGDPDSYVQRMKLLGQIPVINQNFQSRGKALEDLRIAYNKGELGQEDMENAAEMFRVGDPRKLKGKVNKLFGNAAVTDDGMMVKSPYNRVNVNKEVDVYLGDLAKQNIGIFASKYPTMYQNIKGIPSDQEQLKQLVGADYKDLQGVKTMEDLAASVWESNENLQKTYLDNNRKDLLDKFEKDGLPIAQNPKAMEYARAKFIDEQKNRAKAEMKLEGIKQVSNGGKNNTNYIESNDGSFSSEKSGGWKFTIQPDGSYLVNTESTSGIGKQPMVVMTIPKPILDDNDQPKMLNGRPLYTKSETKKETLIPTNVDYLGSDIWLVTALNADGKEVQYNAKTPSIVSFFDQKAVDKIKNKNPNKTYTNRFVEVKDYKAPNAPKVVAPKKGGAPRPNK